MEDLRNQIQDQWITTVGNSSLWTIRITKNDLFNETSTRSLYFVNSKMQQPVGSDTPIILDDDRNLYDRYVENAIQDIMVLLSRRIPQSKSEYPELFKWKEGEDDSTVINDDNALEVNLLVSENHDKNMLKPLANACKEYLVCKVLEQWYGTEFGSVEYEKKIVHTLQYRRKSIMRKVRPLL